MEYNVNDVITRYNPMSKKYELYVVKEVLKVIASEKESNIDKYILMVAIYTKGNQEERILLHEKEVCHRVEIKVNEREVL